MESVGDHREVPPRPGAPPLHAPSASEADLVQLVIKIERQARDILYALCTQTPTGRHRALGKTLSVVLKDYQTVLEKRSRRKKLDKEVA